MIYSQVYLFIDRVLFHVCNLPLTFPISHNGKMQGVDDLDDLDDLDGDLTPSYDRGSDFRLFWFSMTELLIPNYRNVVLVFQPVFFFCSPRPT